MIKWILENKEWVFSGIGVFILGFLIVGVRKLFVKKKTTVNTQSNQTIKSDTDTEKIKTIESEQQKIIKNLTPEAVVNAVKSVPPLQRKDVAKHYKGIRVQWSGTVENIMELSSSSDVFISLRSNESKYVSIAFTVNPANHKGLSLINIGHTINVEGDIKDADRYIITLNNVQLNF